MQKSLVDMMAMTMTVAVAVAVATIFVEYLLMIHLTL